MSKIDKFEVKLLLDSCRGIYIPKNFYDDFDFGSWGLQKCNYEELSDPENEFYWDGWCQLLDNATHTDKEGKTWTLWHNGDLWAQHAKTSAQIALELGNSTLFKADGNVMCLGCLVDYIQHDTDDDSVDYEEHPSGKCAYCGV